MLCTYACIICQKFLLGTCNGTQCLCHFTFIIYMLTKVLTSQGKLSSLGEQADRVTGRRTLILNLQVVKIKTFDPILQTDCWS